ncbi:MAG: FAD-dependent oxidoreductase [Haloarculaceae archaeon]
MPVAVLGAGYAGLTAARRLERRLPDEVELVVVNDSPAHLVQHELHRVVRRPDLAEDITVPLADVLARAEVVEGYVESVDADAGVATLESGEVVEYDYGVLALGATTAFYDLPGVVEHAIPLKRLEDARRIRESFLASDAPRAVVGGAGLSGVQVAGELAALAEEEGLDADVILLEQLDEVAPSFGTRFGDAIRSELEDCGVLVRTRTTVAGATADAVELSGGGELPYDTFVWTGGIAGSEATGGDRPVVRADLRLGERTFAVGDAARIVDASGEAVPASAQSAVRAARVAATNVARLVEHERSGGGGFRPRLEGFDFDSPGWVVSIGDGAVAQVGPTVLRGTAARAAKASVGGAYLGSVGAVSKAVDLVREELGWPAAEALEAEAPSPEPEDTGVRDEPVEIRIDDDATGERE